MTSLSDPSIIANNDNKRRIIISGHAVAPQGTVLYETKKLITVVLEIDWESGEVLDAETTFMTSLANNFFRQLIVGKNLVEDYHKIKELIQRNMHVDTKRALLKALSVIHERYNMLRINEFSNLKRQYQM